MNIQSVLDMTFGINTQFLSMWNMIARGIVVYILGIILARFNKRFMTLRTTHNFFLFIIIGSILASAIVGSLFYETLGMAILLFILNWFIVVIEYYWSRFHIMIQGNPIILVDDGVILTKALNQCFITERELISLLRLRTNSENMDNVEKAYLEITGEITFILKQ